MSKHLVWVLAVALLAALAAGVQAGEMKKPEAVTVSGQLIDVTCAAKGKAMMDSWKNTGQDHMMPDGSIAENCATMCLKGGQPAGLFKEDKIVAVFACNPRSTLADYAAQDVEVQGFWAGGPSDTAKTFVPAKIRAKGGTGWADVNCATMHG